MPLPGTVLFYDVLPGAGMPKLAEAGRLRPIAGPAAVPGLSEADRAEVAVLITMANTGCDAAMLALLPRLRQVISLGAGTDKLDHAGMAARGIAVRPVGEALTDDVADLAMGLAIAAGRDLVQADAFARSGTWAAKGRFRPGRTLSGATIGIAGLGRIGQAIAARAQAARMTVAGLERPSARGLGFQLFPDMRALAAASDFLVLVLPGGAETRGVVGAAELAALGRDGILVNVGRGPQVDTQALIEALEQGIIAAAALDVLDGEPVVPERLAKLPNVILTPHIGGATWGARARAAAIAQAEAMKTLGLDQ